MRNLIGTVLATGLALVTVGCVGAAVRGESGQSTHGPAAGAAADPPVVVLSRQELLGALIRSGAASKDTVLASCPKDLQIDVAPDGSVVRTSGLGIYHRQHPEIWILADGTCAVDPQAAGTQKAPVILP